MVYIICFFISTLFAHLASKTNNKIIFYLCSILCILLPSILAGCRNFSIGTDTQDYIWIYCDTAKKANNLYEYIFDMHGGQEPLFLLLIYIILKLTNSANMVLFVEELIIMLCIYIGIYKHKDKCVMPLALLIFFFLHYNSTYNMTRQYLAMAILFLGLYSLERKEYFKYVMYIIVAILFHTSAFIAFGLLGIKYFFVDKKHKIYYVIFMGIIVILSVALVPIIKMVINLHILDSRFLGYLNGEYVITANFLSAILIVVLLFLTIRHIVVNKTKEDIIFYKKNMIMELVLLWATKSISFGNRIAIYFGITDLILFSTIPKFVRTKNQRILLTICISGLFMFYWYYVSVNGNSGETYPYVSDILKIY